MKRQKLIRYAEGILNILYLCAVFMMGVRILLKASSPGDVLFGVMALVLVSGDLCHLAPRIALSFSGDAARLSPALAAGKMIASVSMTLFYVLLWHIGVLYFSPAGAAGLTGVIYLLAAARVTLAVLPQNKWGEKAPAGAWGLYRNIPFVLLGCIVGFLFYFHKDAGAAGFRWMWAAVLLSFAFYMPVVLGAGKYPALGMLMLPKSWIYVWIITMGL